MYKESITNILSTKNMFYTNENVSFITLVNILGDSTVDLSRFQFINNRLEIRLTNILGDTKILTNSNTKVVTNNSNILAEANTTNAHYLDCENTVYILGENILGEINVL